MRKSMLGLLPFLFACAESDAGTSDGLGGGAAAARDAAPIAPTGDASISGTVRFGGAVPANPVIDMSSAPACLAMYGGGKPTDFIVDGKEGGLANVFVRVRSGLPERHRYPAPTAAAAIAQDECRLKPRVVGLMAGQPLEIRNGDSVSLSVTAAPRRNEGFALELASEDAVARRTFTTPEIVVPLRSDEHGWLRAYVAVVDHPFFAVTDATGAFRIEGLPPGTYELEAWHETLGTRTATVRVGAGQAETTQIDFTSK